MEDRSTLGTVCKILAVLMLVMYLTLLIQAASAGIGGLAAILATLIWPALLWSVGELLDGQKRHEQKLDRILELLGGGEDPEGDQTDLEKMEARLEKAVKKGTQAEPKDE